MGCAGKGKRGEKVFKKRSNADGKSEFTGELEEGVASSPEEAGSAGRGRSCNSHILTLPSAEHDIRCLHTKKHTVDHLMSHSGCE